MIDWWDAAACRGLPLDMFFVNEQESEHGTGTLPDLGTLRRMCAGCPALEECRDHAIRHEEYGFWGGMTARARQNARRELGIRMSRPELAA